MADNNLRDREFIGRGLSFPLRFDPQGRISLTRGEDEIQQSIRIILETSPGERVMRPEFGCRIWELLYEPLDATTEALMVRYVQEALAQWEPRITVLDISTVEDDRYDSAVLIYIRYEIKSTHDERSIVYPFYIDGEE